MYVGGKFMPLNTQISVKFRNFTDLYIREIIAFCYKK